MPMHTSRSIHFQKQRGFTLIELLVTVAIVAILMGIAIPSYTRYVVEQGRSDGQAAIMLLASQIEKFKYACGTYVGAENIDTGSPVFADGCSGLGLRTQVSAEQKYTLAVPITTASTFTITATPLGTQLARDTDCGTLSYNHLGIKNQTGPNTSGRCWRR